MDKNTVRGLILIGLVFIVFMWMSPKQENQPTPAQTQAEEKATEQAEQTRQAILTDQEQEWLRENILDCGLLQTDADGRAMHRIQGTDYNICLQGDTLKGTLELDGRTLPVEAVLKGDSTLDLDTRTRATARLNDIRQGMARYGRLARFANGTAVSHTLRNANLEVTLTSQGAQLQQATLLGYDTEYNPDETKNTKQPVTLMHPGTNRLDFVLPVGADVHTSDLCFTPREANDTTVLYALEFGDGAYWGIRYTLPKGDSYLLSIDIEQKGMDRALKSRSRDLTLEWAQAMPRFEKGKMFEERNSALYYMSDGDVEDLSNSADDARQHQIEVKWIGFKNQFFSSILISRTPFKEADMASVVLDKEDFGAQSQSYLKFLTARGTVTSYDWTNPNPARFDLFLGPNLYPLLSSIDKHVPPAVAGGDSEDLNLTRVIPLGWSIFRWINTLIIIPVFNWLGHLDWNYGIIILLLTVFIKIILFPLTYKSFKGQAKMRVLAPDIKAINEKYPGQENAMIRQQKTMALYSKAGANPMAGCLPLLLQMPILFAMFSFFPSCIELRGQSFLWCHDLSAPDAIISWKAHIPFVSEYFGNHISLFCLLMTVTNIIYTRINMQTQSDGTPGMKWMMYLMPVLFMVFFNNYAAGLSYYYFVSLLITIAQTYAIRRWVVKEDDVRRAMAQNAKKPKKKSGFMARLEEAQRKQQEALRAQQNAGRKNRR